MRRIESTTVISKGTFQESKIKYCNTDATKNSLKDAPRTLETKKK